MSKVGILSMQRIKNYGSFLQAYALKRIIEDLGYIVEFVDYRVEEPIIKDGNKEKGKLAKGLEALKGYAKFSHKIQYIKHKRNFNKYFSMLDMNEEYNYNPKLGTLVIGSDEVFNVIQSNSNVGYSLELFGKDNNAEKVITYAASFGNTTLEKINKFNKTEEIAELLKKIDRISVRDANSYNVVKELTGTEPVINLDPVLMYDYMNKCTIPSIEKKEKYMILYAYNGRISKDEAKQIKKDAQKRGVKVYSIGGAQPYADKFIDCSPFEVLAYFKNAEYIVTDTFHGSIFSIINQKPFITLVRKSKENSYGNEEKLTYLLEELKLRDRICFDYKNANSILETKIEYEKVFEIINTERQKTLDYLKNNIKKNEEINLVKNEKRCCGCSMCANACPVNAIQMKENENGFIYPEIDREKCIKCGKCIKTCEFQNQELEFRKSEKVYAMQTKNVTTQVKSASGGVFYTIAKRFIENGGVVYGSELKVKDNSAIIKHSRIDNTDELYKLQGSKYVQSDTNDIFNLVEKDLKANKEILFSGTPCQVASIIKYTQGYNEKLYTIDIICHGVPNNRMFNDYLKNVLIKNKEKLVNFKFREKGSKKGSLNYNYQYNYLDTIYDKIEPAYKSSYYQLFLDSKIYRKNCYECPYAKQERISDITIGDYWGITEEHRDEVKKFKIQNGTSCALINTKKGSEILYLCEELFEILESDIKKVAKHNHQLNEPSKNNSNEYMNIFKTYRLQGYKSLDKYYKRKNCVKNCLKRIRDII